MSYFFAGDLTQLCGDNCPLECEAVTYWTSTSSAVYPSDIYASKMVNNEYLQWSYDLPSNMTIEELRSNILSINVHYASLSYQSFSEVEKTSVVDLVAGIGGTLGLFLGVSFLSFIELFDLILCLLLAFFERSKVVSPTAANNRGVHRSSLSTNNLSQAANYDLGERDNKKTFGKVTFAADVGYYDYRTTIDTA